MEVEGAVIKHVSAILSLAALAWALCGCEQLLGDFGVDAVDAASRFPNATSDEGSVDGTSTIPDATSKDGSLGDASSGVSSDVGVVDPVAAGRDSGGGGSDSGGGCVIGGMAYPSGALDPTNNCESCQRGLSTSSWSNVADGRVCGSVGICHAGTCGSGCEIGGVYFAANSTGANACQVCRPSNTTSGWTTLADGTNCGNGEVCAGGLCGTQCDIGGKIYASRAANPMNACQTCQPGTSTSAWTNTTNGANCGSGEVCYAGSCVACTPSVTRCVGTTPQTCSVAGQWVSDPVVAGTCGALCTPDATERCGPCGDGTATCNASGSWGGCVGGTSPATFYRDVDGDGFGNPSSTTTACSAPLGYVADNTDCYDNNGNAHPGQSGWFTVDRGDGSFDYDCDGIATEEITAIIGNCCTLTNPVNVCTQTISGFSAVVTCYRNWQNIVNSSPPGCGMSGQTVATSTCCSSVVPFTECGGANGEPGCLLAASTSGTATQACH
jgi:hypothetical protein